MLSNERGQTMVEYAIITATIVAVLFVLLKVSQPGIYKGWLENIRRVFLVSIENFSDAGNLWKKLTQI